MGQVSFTVETLEIEEMLMLALVKAKPSSDTDWQAAADAQKPLREHLKGIQKHPVTGELLPASKPWGGPHTITLEGAAFTHLESSFEAAKRSGVYEGNWAEHVVGATKALKAKKEIPAAPAGTPAAAPGQ